jgi:hypothetical protein
VPVRSPPSPPTYDATCARGKISGRRSLAYVPTALLAERKPSIRASKGPASPQCGAFSSWARFGGHPARSPSVRRPIRCRHIRGTADRSPVSIFSQLSSLVLSRQKKLQKLARRPLRAKTARRIDQARYGKSHPPTNAHGLVVVINIAMWRIKRTVSRIGILLRLRTSPETPVSSAFSAITVSPSPRRKRRF